MGVHGPDRGRILLRRVRPLRASDDRAPGYAGDPVTYLGRTLTFSR